jgi:hypothetical protein
MPSILPKIAVCLTAASLAYGVTAVESEIIAGDGRLECLLKG